VGHRTKLAFQATEPFNLWQDNSFAVVTLLSIPCDEVAILLESVRKDTKHKRLWLE
jgi:hypothetical protein